MQFNSLMPGDLVFIGVDLLSWLILAKQSKNGRVKLTIYLLPRSRQTEWSYGDTELIHEEVIIVRQGKVIAGNDIHFHQKVKR